MCIFVNGVVYENIFVLVCVFVERGVVESLIFGSRKLSKYVDFKCILNIIRFMNKRRG